MSLILQKIIFTTITYSQDALNIIMIMFDFQIGLVIAIFMIYDVLGV